MGRKFPDNFRTTTSFMQPLKDGTVVTLTYNRPDGYPHISLMIVFYSTLIDQYVFATYANSTKMNAFKQNDLVTINYGNLRKNETAVFMHGQAVSLNREDYDDVYREMFYKHKQMMQYYFDTPENPNYQLFYVNLKERCYYPRGSMQEKCYNVLKDSDNLQNILTDETAIKA